MTTSPHAGRFKPAAFLPLLDIVGLAYYLSSVAAVRVRNVPNAASVHG
jgi:hypothetical protein